MKTIKVIKSTQKRVDTGISDYCSHIPRFGIAPVCAHCISNKCPNSKFQACVDCGRSPGASEGVKYWGGHKFKLRGVSAKIHLVGGRVI